MDTKLLQTITQNFKSELEKASRGEASSLSWFIHKIPSKPLVKEGEVFQVLVIGGSVCKNALVTNEGGKPKILKKEEKRQPVFHAKGDVIPFIDQELERDIRILALNFAYPLDPVFEKGRLDGVLLRGSKENEFKGLTGRQVGVEVELYFKKSGRDVTVSVANDTICLLLSGLTSYSWDRVAAGIVGTGINFALFLDKHNLVNLESAQFDKFPRSKALDDIDKRSSQRGKALFEKEVSGAYLYQHFNDLVKKREVEHRLIYSTEDLNRIARASSKASKFTQGLFRKSAELVACQAAGIAKFLGRDLNFVMEGSLFWKGYEYKETVDSTVKKLVPEFDVKFVEIKDSAILGASKLVS